MGSKEGAAKARDKNLANNPDFYRIIGAKGGKAAKPENRPFARDHKLASRAGTIGGTVSRRK